MARREWSSLFDLESTEGPCLPHELVLSVTGRSFFANKEGPELVSSLAGWSSDPVPAAQPICSEVSKQCSVQKSGAFTATSKKCFGAHETKLEYTTKRMAALFVEGFYYKTEQYYKLLAPATVGILN
jgi:hypothetical protein